MKRIFLTHELIKCALFIALLLVPQRLVVGALLSLVRSQMNIGSVFVVVVVDVTQTSFLWTGGSE